MKTPILIFLAIPLMALSSCSSVKQTAAKIQQGTAKSFRTVKEKTFGPSKPKLRLTKAQPSRFLPEGTSAEKVHAKSTPSHPSKTQTRLLAKHTKPSSGPRPASASTSARSQAGSQAPAAIPELELPPLPTTSASDDKEFRGILPSLDGSDTATFIDVNGETPELPPLEFPDLEDEEELAPEAAA